MSPILYCDTKRTAMTMSRQRKSRSRSCSMMSRRRLRFCDLRRNSIAAQRMRLKRMRLIRWMMIGELTRAPPATTYAGLVNRGNIPKSTSGTLQIADCKLQIANGSLQAFHFQFAICHLQSAIYLRLGLGRGFEHRHAVVEE